jgi:alpha-L-arabinofuranosidase
LRFFYSVTRDSRNGKLYLEMVNATASPRTVAIRLNGVSSVSKNAKTITLSATTTQSTNTIVDPKKIVPKESAISYAAPQFSHTLPPYSIQVMELEAH